MKPGTVFEHRYWLDTKHMPLLCRVTSVRDGTVHWTYWEDGALGRARYWFDLAEADKHVGRVIEPEGAGGSDE